MLSMMLLQERLYLNKLAPGRRNIQVFTLALESNPEIEESSLWLAAALAHAGRIDDASWQLEQIRVSGRDLSLELSLNG